MLLDMIRVRREMPTGDHRLCIASTHPRCAPVFLTPSLSSPDRLRDTCGSFRCFHDRATGQSSRYPPPPAVNAWLWCASPHAARASSSRGSDTRRWRVGPLAATGSQRHGATWASLGHWERRGDRRSHPVLGTRFSAPERLQTTTVSHALCVPYRSVARRCWRQSSPEHASG